jgi:hypothetical protein
MVTPGAVVCPKCREDRPTMIEEVITKGVSVYFCKCCSHDFKRSERLPEAVTRLESCESRSTSYRNIPITCS